jgi:hypothetical protein
VITLRTPRSLTVVASARCSWRSMGLRVVRSLGGR